MIIIAPAMALSPGTKLGPYEIVAPIGSGGMGDVYRARDNRLNRDVAIKVLPPVFAKDRERLMRFEREARATASLNHPNILAIYDVGTENNVPYIVSELLEGHTLRHRIISRTFPAREASKYAAQVAQGLSVAHAKGIVHRDLKPENIFITQSGIAKILDFGIAKLTQPEAISSSEDGGSGDTATLATDASVVLGTTGYMSPEQIRNTGVDYRSDIFSFGAILFEMFAGKKAFSGRTTADTVSSILRDEPTEVAENQEAVPPGIQRIVRHCLEKDREKRYQSTLDLVFDLEEMSGLSHEIPIEPPIRRSNKKMWLAAIAAVLLAVLLTAVFFGRRQTPPPPAYQRLTFLRGTVWSARFSPDGQTILYSASWNGAPMNIFTTRAEALDSRSMGLENAQLLAITPSGQMSILVKRRYLSHHLSLGTLAEVSSISGTPREVLDDVQEADWSPNGTDLAVVRHVSGRSRLEFPVGKVLYQPGGWISNPRVSPAGDKIAFLEHPVQGDNRGWVSVIELNGKKTVLTPEWAGAEGLAWSPDGREVWFTANKSGGANSLFAVLNAGKLRTLATAPVNLILLDVARNGDVLVSGGNESSEFFALNPGAGAEHDVSWLDWGAIRDLSPDGRTLIFTHFGEKSGKNCSVYLRQLNASTAVRLGPGSGWGLSPDGKQVISILADPAQVTLLPTGAGEAENLPSNGIEEYGLGGSWFPDGKKIVFIGREHNHPPRTYLQDINGGKPEPLTPEGVTGTLLSSDGKSLIATDAAGNRLMFPVAGGSPAPISGLSSEDRIIRFSSDDRSLFVLDDENASGKIYRVDLATGRRELWKSLNPADPAGIREFKTALLTPDGKYYVYGLTRSLTSLYLTHVGE